MRVVWRSSGLAGLSKIFDRAMARSNGATWLFPILIILMLTSAVAVAVGVDLRLGVVSPHPFWLAVLVACLQGGVTAGLATTVTAAALALAFGVAPPIGGEDFYDHGWRVSHDPLLWLAASVGIGGVRGRHLAVLSALEARLSEVERQRLAIARAFAALKTRCEDLEREQACATAPGVPRVVAAFDRLLVASPAERQEALAHLVELVIGEADWAVLEPRDGGLVESLAWRVVPSDRTAIALSRPAADELERRRAALIAHRECDAELLGSAGQLALPIVHPRDGRLLGAFLICRFEAGGTTPAVEAVLGIVARALAHVLAGEGAVVSLEKRRRFWRLRSVAEDIAPPRTVDRPERRVSDPYG